NDKYCRDCQTDHPGITEPEVLDNSCDDDDDGEHHLEVSPVASERNDFLRHFNMIIREYFIDDFIKPLFSDERQQFHFAVDFLTVQGVTCYRHRQGIIADHAPDERILDDDILDSYDVDTSVLLFEKPVFHDKIISFHLQCVVIVFNGQYQNAYYIPCGDENEDSYAHGHEYVLYQPLKNFEVPFNEEVRTDKVDEPEYYGKECTECSACHAHENEGLSGHLIQRNELFRLAFNRWCLFSWPPAEFTDFHCTVQLIHFIVQNGLDGLCL